MEKVLLFLQKRKYEILLIALLLHLFIGIFLSDLAFYTKVIWPVNMVILGVASVGVFIEKGRWKNVIRAFLFWLVLLLPLSLPFAGKLPGFMQVLSIMYVLFFLFIFCELMKFLVRPGYINTDIISAAACGYLLLIEMSVFLMQVYFYHEPGSFKGIDTSGPAAVYTDLVYFCSITFTSIGFGDITPNAHYTKLLTSLLGIAGQFYSVVLVGILISKFSSKGN
ncbi:MAG: potassium channel family protein [Ferruginibacter sp.]